MKNCNLQGKKLLVLAGADVHIKIVKAAKELGVYTIVTDYLKPEDSPAKQIADESWMLSITDVDAIVEKCKEAHVDGVLAFCIDPAQIPYQQVCEKLQKPCYGTKEQFQTFTNKRPFKDFCKAHNVGVIPEYTVADVENDNVKYPVLVKPTDSRGSRGISICNNKDEVYKALEIAKAESHDNGALIERYMYGKQDMAFAYMVIDGQPYLVKIGDRIVGKVEDNLQCQHMATILPSKNTEQFKRDIEPNIIKMIQATGMKFGSLFLQGFWEDGQVFMYDPGLRFPGSDFDVVTKETTGFDSMKAFVHFALTGDTTAQYGNPEIAYNYNGGICLILSVATRPGTIATFQGMDVIAANPCVRVASQRYRTGETVPQSGDVRQRVAEFVAFLPKREEVQKFIDFVYEKLSILDENGNDMIVSKVVYTH
ncbi:acetyl-CoA carboxylase biotin carboxylase subunit family protein [Fibrobacter sp. UWEL]|uniref:ATP-grasp domain-containing protein n=1 Tax=Fibrobacter sp. UWEL TaxID=1896209 RepID=UPI000919500A|nr:hypothetical protein [Fibrobacter sp. UWEL]SHK91781.1 Biotin carboxylase [Fibrobacter sp. UWEL]